MRAEAEEAASRARRELHIRQHGPEWDAIAEDREACKRLWEFVRRAWHVLEPTRPFVDGWHIGAKCEHFEAISAGEILRLLVNEPPGHMKSLVASVMWEAWEWGPLGRPGLRYLTTSYQEGYAKRDARKMRDLVLSEWYQARWPIELIRIGEASFENTHRGGREAKPFKSLTAGRGNRMILDDPHSTEEVESEADRNRATRLFRESVPSRINDPAKDAIIVIMHRLHPRDICGVIEELGLPYVKLILPMEFEPDRRCVTSIGFKDPRARAGEILFPEMFSPTVLAAKKQELTSHAYAGQYQQRPAAREGGMFKRHWFRFVEAIPAEAKRKVRRWDLAASLQAHGGDPDWTANVRMSASGDGRFFIEDVNRFRETAGKVRSAIKNTAAFDGRAVYISIPQDPGQAGKDQSTSIIGENAGYKITAERETGDKATRAEPLAAQTEAGNIYLLRAPWNEMFIDEMCGFPQGHDDMFDAATGAFNHLAAVKAPLVITATILARAAQRAIR